MWPGWCGDCLERLIALIQDIAEFGALLRSSDLVRKSTGLFQFLTRVPSHPWMIMQCDGSSNQSMLIATVSCPSSNPHARFKDEVDCSSDTNIYPSLFAIVLLAVVLWVVQERLKQYGLRAGRL